MAIVVVKGLYEDAGRVHFGYHWYARVKVKGETNPNVDDSRILHSIPNAIVVDYIRFMCRTPMLHHSSLITKYHPHSDNRKPLSPHINGWKRVSGIKTRIAKCMRTWRTIGRVVGKLRPWHARAVERLYAPGGAGYVQAEADFKERASKSQRVQAPKFQGDYLDLHKCPTSCSPNLLSRHLNTTHSFSFGDPKLGFVSKLDGPKPASNIMRITLGPTLGTTFVSKFTSSQTAYRMTDSVSSTLATTVNVPAHQKAATPMSQSDSGTKSTTVEELD
jgi:hypothetical protein